VVAEEACMPVVRVQEAVLPTLVEEVQTEHHVVWLRGRNAPLVVSAVVVVDLAPEHCHMLAPVKESTFRKQRTNTLDAVVISMQFAHEGTSPASSQHVVS